jgi:SAM-dependent methyltransferase
MIESKVTEHMQAVQTAPRPHIAEKRHYYPGCAMEAFIVPLLREQIEKAVVSHTPSDARELVALDVGCGGQPFRALLERRGYTYIGLDVNQNPEGTVTIITAIDESLPTSLPTAGVDFILCTEVLEHVADWQKAFANLSYLLRPGGRVVITVPFFYPLHEEPYDFWRPTIHAITRFAVAAGLQTVEVSAVGDGWDVLGTLLGNARFATRSRRLSGRILARLLNWYRFSLFTLMKYRWLQREVSFLNESYKVYLSNVAVLRKD